MSRPWKERTAVYIVRVCEGFKPTSVCQWPESFTEARLHVRNISLTDALRHGSGVQQGCDAAESRPTRPRGIVSGRLPDVAFGQKVGVGNAASP